VGFRARALLRPAVGLLLAAAAAGGILTARLPVLQLKNLDRGLLRRVRIEPPERFAMTYRHSIYDAPVTEEFEASRGGIVLKGVRTEDAGVMEYYGFEEVRGEHPREVALKGPLVVKKGVREGQGLLIGGRPLPLSDLARPGERVEVSVQAVSIYTYLMEREP
jgi:hypothetical protein